MGFCTHIIWIVRGQNAIRASKFYWLAQLSAHFQFGNAASSEERVFMQVLGWDGDDIIMHADHLASEAKC